MVREFKFKGYSLQQLQSSSIESILPLLNSRQRRSLDKRVDKYMNDEKRKLREEIKMAREGKLRGLLKTHVRDMIVLPEMIGHYLGEYATTNKRVQHGAPGVGSSRSSLYVPLK